MGVFAGFKKSFAKQDVLDADSPRDILLTRRSSALEEIDDHQNKVKLARATVEGHQQQIDRKTKLVTDIDAVLKVID